MNTIKTLVFSLFYIGLLLWIAGAIYLYANKDFAIIFMLCLIVTLMIKSIEE